jgi:ubiquinone/menaquinone biosynthesis C-methylase UbiE
MQSLLSIGILLVLIIIVALIWRLFSNRASLPCPSWLGWMVEMDNPVLRNNSARAIVSHLALEPGMRILDFGCGPGRLAIPVARLIGPSGTVTAFDIQPGMLERVRAKAVSEKLDNIEYIQGTAGEGRLGTSQYDRALIVTVLGEIPDRQTLMKEIFESLKPGAWLSVTEAIADPHFLRRSSVSSAAASTGFLEKYFFGNKISYTIIFEKPQV